MSAEFKRTGNEPPFSMPDNYDTHLAFKGKAIGYKTKRVFQNYLTSDNYEDSLVFDMRLFSKVLIHIKEQNVNAVKYNILACLDPSQWETLKANTTIPKNGSATETCSDAWNYIKVQIASNVAGASGKVNAFVGGKTP